MHYRMTLIFVGLLAIVTNSGCAGVGAFCAERINAHHDRREIRQDTREALLRQEIEALRSQAELDRRRSELHGEEMRIKNEICIANQEAVQRDVKRQIKESVHSKVALNVVQGLEFGEIEVDVEALKTMLKKREEEKEREPLTRNRPPTKSCCCQQQPCGCAHGLLKCHCSLCCRKPCEKCRCEQTCGDEAFQRLAEEPLQRPLRPAEIPLKLPVKLSFGVDQPDVEVTRVVQEPLIGEPFEKQACPPQCPLPNPCRDPNRCSEVIAPGEVNLRNLPPAPRAQMDASPMYPYTTYPLPPPVPRREEISKTTPTVSGKQ